MSGKESDNADKFKVFSPRSHLWSRPGMYVGSTAPREETVLVIRPEVVARANKEPVDAQSPAAVMDAAATAAAAMDAAMAADHEEVADAGAGVGVSEQPEATRKRKPSKLGKRGMCAAFETITRFPALEKVYDEIIMNALDRVTVDPTIKTMRVSVTADGTISVYNDGAGIPVVHKQVEGKDMYIPEVVFSHFRAGSNFEDEPRYTGGMNGYGAKLTNVLSSRFEVVTADGKHKFTQVWTGPPAGTGMRATKGPVIKECAKSFTQVTFRPYYTWFGVDDADPARSLDPGVLALLRTRVLSAACTTPRPIAVEWHEPGCKLTIPAALGASIKDLAQLLHPSPPAYDRADFVHSSRKGDKAVSCDSLAVCCIPRPDGLDAVALGFVNTLECSQGTHIRFAVSKVAAALIEALRKRTKKPDLAITPKMVEKRFFFFVEARVASPAFDSQAKDQLCTPFTHKEWVPSDSFCKALDAMAGDELVRSATQKETKTAASAVGAAKRVYIKDYDPASSSGRGALRGKRQISLILTEGLSAKALATACKSVLGSSTTGIYPLRGKLKNARGLNPTEFVKNAECKNLAAILGLEPGRAYSRAELEACLQYTSVWIFTDQDPDGDHICGLILNLFDAQWPSLLEHVPGFLKRFRTPLLRVLPAGPAFFSRPEFEAWRIAHCSSSSSSGAAAAAASGSGSGAGAVKVKYYKGLGTSTSA
jgi:DNA topoisomerase-2